MKTTALVMSTIAFISAAPAFAASITVEDLLATYNGISAGNFNSSQEVEGRLYVGGNLTGNTIQVAFVPQTPVDPVQNLVVVGNSTIGKIGANGEAVFGGNVNTSLERQGGELTAFVGGSFSGNHNQVTVNTNQSGPAYQAKFPDIDFAAIADYSAYLATLTGKPWTWADQNNKQLVSDPNAVQSEGTGWIASKVTVLYTTLAALATGGLSVAGLDPDETIIVNVAGTSGKWGLNGLGDAKAHAKNIVWNFYEAESISVNSAIIGSVLAPKAAMSGFSGSTEGSVLAKSIDLNNGELHYQPFFGDLPEPPVSPVPLPAGMPLLAGALGLAALLRRKRA